ncbi:MAG: hypothetical protein GVY17_09280 [Cyanobacteria bacterium]|jgi:uncharacterized membrane protein|nr:hypothetical protein [Cyanobacteria bacterium GSL.Bin21]
MTEIDENNESSQLSPEDSVVVPRGITYDGIQNEEISPNVVQEQQPSRHLVGELQIRSSNSPLPDPYILEKYQELGYGQEVVNLIWKQQEHRHNLEIGESQHRQRMDEKLVNNYIESTKLEHEDRKRGQQYALAVTLAAILSGAIVAGITSSKWAGGVIGASGSLAGVASTFIQGRKQDSKKDEEIVESSELVNSRQQDDPNESQ